MKRDRTLCKSGISLGAGVLLCALAILSSASAALAEDASTNAPAKAAVTNSPPPKHWDTVVSADATITRGNSHSTLLTATVNSKGKYDKNEFLLSGAAGYGDNTARDSNGNETTTKTQDYLKGTAQWNYLITDRFYAGLKLDALHDDLADINYRFTVSPLAGYYLIKKPQTELAVEAGPSYVYEQVGGRTDSYFGARVGERFEHKFKSGAKIWESFEWITQVDKVDNWIANAEVGVSAPITKALDVRVVAQDNYDNIPAPGRLKNDFKLLAGIGYRF
jgi:hypothetical protein